MQETKKFITLVGVDAKKTFESLDHNYMLEVLESYGFGPKFLS
jgi:hypothetical protein